ncbi:hypothetical protein A5660_00625 [Mycobacterium alsense]|nr:hypothetical protein A5660_00625 [Mycobacterium alsense]
MDREDDSLRGCRLVLPDGVDHESRRVLQRKTTHTRTEGNKRKRPTTEFISIPLSADVDLDEVAAGLDGYSAADCVALLREAALTAMRRSMDATHVTAGDLDAARKAVRPSLDPAQLESLRAFAESF